jgi:4-methyl-5(b-hydroxyethyl)-thiazole monophosphate biosynthesis
MSKVLVILAPGFEEIEAITVIDILRRARIETTVAGLESISITGSHSIEVKCDAVLSQIDPRQFTHLFLPGGQPGTANLCGHQKVLELVKSFNEKNKVLAAICAAPTVLQAAGILTGKRITSYPSEREKFSSSIYQEENVVRDVNIITSRGVGTAVEFALALVENISGIEIKKDIAKKILWFS